MMSIITTYSKEPNMSTRYATLPTATFAVARRDDLRAPLASRRDCVHSLEALTVRLRPMSSEDPDDEPTDDDWSFGLVNADFTGDWVNELDQGQSVAHVLGMLSPDQQKVLRLRFGLAGQPQTLQQIGDSEGVTRERIRQIEAAALKRIRLALGVRPAAGTSDVASKQDIAA